MIIKEFEGREYPESYKRWTEDEIDTLKRYYGKVLVREIAPYLKNRSQTSIRYKAHELGLAVITERKSQKKEGD
jgi:hypothetical protein